MSGGTRTLVGALLLLAGAAGADTLVSSCGTVVPAGTVGVLAGDLSCAGAPVGITLARGATLQMAGFSIRDTSLRALECPDGGCSVVGGATSAITDCMGSGIAITSTARLLRRGLVVSDLLIEGCGGTGIDAPMAGVVATRVRTSGHGAHGASAWSLRADDVTASNNGLNGLHVRSKLRGSALVAEQNGINGLQALEGRVRAAGVTVRGNVHAGIAARRLRLDGGDVTGNNTGATGIDLYIGRHPWVRNVACGRSVQLIMIGGGFFIGPTWQVCAND
jgi:hypothetical protein